MADVIGGLFTSHVPAIGGAMARGLQDDPYWQPFFAAWPPVRQWLAATRPDVVVVFYNDHGLNFFLDAMPTFAVGAAAQYTNSDEGSGLAPFLPVAGAPDLSWAINEELVASEFDVTMCQSMQVDHALTIPLALTRHSVHEIVTLAGTQGVEILNWIAARGAMGDIAHEAQRTYHIPISNTAAAVMLLETDAVRGPAAQVERIAITA